MSKQTHKYCRLSSRNIGFYWRDGKCVYLPGLYNSPESLQAYHQAMAEINEAKANDVAVIRPEITATRKPNHLSVLELVVAFLKWGETHYVKNGKPTGSNEDYHLASKPLVEKYGHIQVGKFTQRELIAIRNSMNDNGLSRKPSMIV